MSLSVCRMVVVSGDVGSSARPHSSGSPGARRPFHLSAADRPGDCGGMGNGAGLASEVRVPNAMAVRFAAGLIIARTGIIGEHPGRLLAEQRGVMESSVVGHVNNDVAHTNLSEIYLRAAGPEEAIRHAGAALGIYPNNAQAANNLGVGVVTD